MRTVLIIMIQIGININLKQQLQMNTNKKSFPLIQKGIYCYLNNRGVGIHQMRWAIKQFFKENYVPFENNQYTFEMKQQYVTENFQNFKKFIKRTFVNQQSNLSSYKNNWNEKNLNGSFAYNNASDDF